MYPNPTNPAAVIVNLIHFRITLVPSSSSLMSNNIWILIFQWIKSESDRHAHLIEILILSVKILILAYEAPSTDEQTCNQKLSFKNCNNVQFTINQVRGIMQKIEFNLIFINLLKSVKSDELQFTTLLVKKKYVNYKSKCLAPLLFEYESL